MFSEVTDVLQPGPEDGSARLIEDQENWVVVVPKSRLNFESLEMTIFAWSAERGWGGHQTKRFPIVEAIPLDPILEAEEYPHTIREFLSLR